MYYIEKIKREDRYRGFIFIKKVIKNKVKIMYRNRLEKSIVKDYQIVSLIIDIKVGL